jgi:hypothetical protein
MGRGVGSNVVMSHADTKEAIRQFLVIHPNSVWVVMGHGGDALMAREKGTSNR